MKSCVKHNGFYAFTITVFMCVAMVMSCVFSLNATAASINTLKTTVSLNLRSSASTSSTLVVTMPTDSTVTLLQNSTNGWAKVKYSTYTGYCSTTYLNPVSGSGITMKGKTISEVNLRSGKGTSYSSLTLVPKGTTVSVSSNADSTWAKVTYLSHTGYIHKDYLTVMLSLSSDSAIQSTTQPTVAATSPSYSYSDPSYTGLPSWHSYSITDSLLEDANASVKKLMLSKSNIELATGEKTALTAFLTGSMPVMEHVEFSSSDSTVASVSNEGVVTAKSSGEAVITATDLITSSTAKCTVIVSGGAIIPTETPTQVATTAPTTKPTVKPTVAPTVAPTVKPTVKPTTAPTTAPTVAETLKISNTSITMYTNNHFLLKATSNATVTWSSSDTSVATVTSGGGLVISKSAGKAVITAKTSTKSVSCTVTVKKPSKTVSVSQRNIDVTGGKTFLTSASSTSTISWSSSDTSVATVKNGYIYGVSEGRAIITASVSGGARTMYVKVSEPAPIRFAYTSPNCAPKNGDVTLIAITDKKRTAVKFNVNVGSTTKTVNATSKTSDGTRYIWKAKTSFNSAGTYNVTAYSKVGSTWSTCDDAKTTAFVTSTTDKTTTTCEKRRASDEVIDLIANFEGFLGEVYDDPLTGDPTLGYGRVVYTGQQFYNNLTKNEAYAYLVQTVNNDGYATKVNSFLIDNSVKFNQQHFDALVCFVYNTGTGVLSNDSELRNALLDCNSGSSTTTKTYYINGSAVRIRKGPGTSYDIIKEMAYGTTLKILEKTNSAWYYVQLTDGTKGYVSTDYIASKVSSGSLDLNFVKKQNLINKFCQYHHANGCIYGLLYRRVNEMEIFFYNDYEREFAENKFNIKFICANNPDFHTNYT